MTWRTVLTIALFVGVCGFIAYWGDLLGRRLGKRRLSLFGLRPRYTAIVTTTITGMLIALFTIGFMMVLSKDARTLVIRGEKILRDNRIYLAQSLQARAKARQAAKELRKQQELAHEVRLAAERAVSERDRLAAQRNAIEARLKTLRGELRRNQIALTAAVNRLRRAEADVRSTHKELVDARNEVEKHRREIEAQKVEIQRLQVQSSELEGLIERASERVAQILNKRLIFRHGQEIARKAIRCADSRAEIRRQIDELLDEAGRRAQAEDAKVGANGRAVKLLNVQLVSERETRFATEEELINAVTEQISSGVGTVVTRLVAVGNAYEGDQVTVHFILNPNRLVYAAGDEVARTVIDGSSSPGEILGSLINFLKTEVRSAAIWRGTIPVYDEEGQASVGEVSGDLLLETVERIKAKGKPVIVKAIARTEAWSADPINLNFVVGEGQ